MYEQKLYGDEAKCQHLSGYERMECLGDVRPDRLPLPSRSGLPVFIGTVAFMVIGAILLIAKWKEMRNRFISETRTGGPDD